MLPAGSTVRPSERATSLLFTDMIYIVHPSCLDIDETAATTITLYAWNCVDCKACEVCQKNDDVRCTTAHTRFETEALLQRVIICDSCDRGDYLLLVVALSIQLTILQHGTALALTLR